ncbi:PIR Superfamily Protein [Plasmodium ovale curtisi]|uniref:PIR Superfamily Protein n=1 Tax=Plasmodium ovale curtisi TaxID=864141 RepID=A0A1A8X645_PLAOA|nr:PIR Superfamily Protein [Plasmodium ovale curtisi]SBT00732.1 PIR Superfamily Protein [Plasmodium ovale curtisi]
MWPKNVTGIYDFCRNSPYYQMVVENIKRFKELQAQDAQKIKDACNSFSNDACSFENPSGNEICTNFFCMYKFLNEAYREQDSNSILTHEDFDFLNFWLNVQLKGKDIDASNCISEFEKAIETQDQDFIYSKNKMEKRFHVIDPGNLENMELLYELYDSKRNILNMMRVKDYSNDEHKTCSYYTQKCDENYRKAMDKCINGNADFYESLKDFKISYVVIEEEPQDLKDCKSSPYFHLPKYDPVLERKQRNIMAGKILSAPLILSFVIPLLYKYTPLGPFIRTKINIVKNGWMNSDESGRELSSLPTDIEENISNNGEYNIGYYSGTN